MKTQNRKWLKPSTAPLTALPRNPLLRDQLGCLASHTPDQILWPAACGLDSENLEVAHDEIFLRDLLSGNRRRRVLLRHT
jgi:hypothetical protein